ncbi:hypothetical protein Mal15_34620 [Stieleria maiorica]|uniref:SAM-dependent methyltransferase n=1 Tax=Stieleria maiorica TaxID=2795974 RepID=A0A5B9ME74_9BACT|nr:class I SAM-dependent methyltransferase [Stieleria maiorica]QEF99398.1 hypothetical protein Mal15_34620 [Stieleria maiorica]
MLQPIPIPSQVNTQPIPPSIAAKLSSMRTRIEAFQDRWDQHRAEQFVAADYELVYQTLEWINRHQTQIGSRFLEWGCGFAAVACLADELKWNAHAIEAHADLIGQARKTIRTWPANVDLFDGNFLPGGAPELSLDPTLPSLGHGGQSAYDAWGLELDDFSLVYSYPWPGEDEFHEDVFDRYAAIGALLLMFIGPNEMRLVRKVRR